MDLPSQTIPRRSLRQQGRSPESASVISHSDDSHPNPPTTIPPHINPHAQFNRVPIFPSTMSHDRAHFIPRQHDKAPSPFAYNMTQHPSLQQISQPTAASHATNNFVPPHETLLAPPAENAKNNSTNSIINNAEHIIQEGNDMFLRHAQGRHNSPTSTNIGSSLASQVLPPFQHIQIPQPQFYPPAIQQHYQHHLHPYSLTPPTQDHSFLTQLLADNKQLQETLLAHMSESKEHIHRLFKQNETLQNKLQQSMERNDKLTKQIFQLTVNPTPRQNLPNSQEHVDLLDVNPPLVPAPQPAPTVANQPSPPIPVTTPTVHNQQEHTLHNDLIERLIKISEAQVTLQQYKKDTRNTKFPVFNGTDLDEFLSWYNNVLSILASTGWNDLYDHSDDGPIEEDTAQASPKLQALSADLYSYLHIAMKKDAQTLMEDKFELRGKGLLFLQTLFDAYNVKLSGGELMTKEKEYANVCRMKDEKISTFASRCTKLRRILKSNGITSPREGLKLRFIMGLGPDFSDIQKNLHNLPPEWKTTDMKQLSIVATSYLNSIHSIRQNNAWYKAQNSSTHSPPTSSSDSKKQSQHRQNHSDNKNPSKNDNAKRFQQSNTDRQNRILKDIRDGTFSHEKYAHEVPKGACVWHGTIHKDPNCTVLNGLLTKPAVSTEVLKPPSYPAVVPKAKHTHSSRIPTPTLTPPPMENIDLVDFDAFDQASVSSKDNVKVSNSSQHYSCSTKPVVRNASIEHTTSSPDTKITTNINETTLHRFILDSGAFPHMCTNRNLFTKIFPWDPNTPNQHVTLADGTSNAKIKGIGTITFQLDKQVVTLHNVLYVPSLSHSLFSIKQHCLQQGNYFHTEEGLATLAFSTFIHTVPIKEEIYMDAELIKQNIFTNRVSVPTNTELQPLLSTTEGSNEEPKKISITSQKPSKTSLLTVSYSKLSPDARPPAKGTPYSAGFDLFANEETQLLPGQRKLISTGIALEIPTNLYGRIAARSSLTIKADLDIGAGVIDSDYRGEIFPCLINNSSKIFKCYPGDKIAQIIFEYAPLANMVEKKNPSPTLRNTGGFGSTDKPTIQTKTSDPSSPTTETILLPQWILNKGTKITIKFPWSTSYVLAKTTGESNKIVLQVLDSDTNTELTHSQTHTLIQNKHLLQGHHHNVTSHPDSYLIDPDRKFAQLRVIDKLLPSHTSNKSFTLNQIQKGFGFRNITSIINQIKQTNRNCLISTLDKEPIIDLGQVAAIDKPQRNTTPLPFPPKRGDVVHMDIIYGAGTSIDGVKYSLFLVDRATRYKMMLPIRNLHEDILPNLKKFCSIMGKTPKYLRTDFDHKLIGRHIQQYIEENEGTIESAPPKLQNQNGVCERNWRSLLKMARNWLASSLLPSSFWWHAVKRAAEMANYIPLKLDTKLTTPHELVFGEKPNFQNILPMFSVAYVDYKNIHTLHLQTVKAILIGRSDLSHALEFYHPHTKRVLTSAIYRLDETLTAGPSFGLPYDGGFYFHKFTNTSQQYIAPKFEPNEKVLINTRPTSTPGTVVTIPLQDNNIYTIQLQDGSMHQYPEDQILKTTNSNDNELQLHTIPKWINHLSKVTLFLNSMDKPKHGYLIKQGDEFRFRPGHKTTNVYIPLPNFESTVMNLIETHQIFQGHPHFKKIMQAKQTYLLSKTVARHVSAAGLTSSDVPTLLQHKNLSQGDKQIWDNAYAEEYFGLKNLPAWTSITEQEYKRMRHIYKTTLPTMAISTIKYDEMGKPNRAKYRIVALGNLDPHEWSRADCYAPVMSLLELRLITAIAVRHKRTLKAGDIKQAFVQAVLPPEENYVLKPPPGCPLTPPNTYWLLKRTLYGLKRSPRHWYDKAVQLLHKIGLRRCKHSPCLFYGEVIPGLPPLYLGLYVDDFVYFSESDKVEKEFENKLQAYTTVNFMGTVTHFLGIRFQWRNNNGEVKVHMSQEAFSDQLIEQAGLSHDSATTNPTPYRAGYPVDSIKSPPEDLPYKEKLQQELRSYVGSLVWLSQGTRPDLSTITNILAKYQANPSYGHVAAAKYTIKYIKGTKSRGIVFDSRKKLSITSFVHFPLDPSKLHGICDANWGPQDQSRPKNNKVYDDLDLFKSRSISGHLIILHGPLHWMSKRQKTTARSSAEAEIYATDACVKDLLQLRLILKDLQLDKLFITDKMLVLNDNMAGVQWSKNKTSKGLRHVQIKENGVRENKHLIDVRHCEGSTNLADMMSKEDKNASHFIAIRNEIVPPPFTANRTSVQNNIQVRFSSKITVQKFIPSATPSTIHKVFIPK